MVERAATITNRQEKKEIYRQMAAASYPLLYAACLDVDPLTGSVPDALSHNPFRIIAEQGKTILPLDLRHKMRSNGAPYTYGSQSKVMYRSFHEYSTWASQTSHINITGLDSGQSLVFGHRFSGY